MSNTHANMENRYHHGFEGQGRRKSGHAVRQLIDSHGDVSTKNGYQGLLVDFNHFKIIFARTALWTYPIQWHIFPARAGSNSLLRQP